MMNDLTTTFENDMPISQQAEVMDISPENIIQLAQRADQYITAVNKIMTAALKITNERDWVLIGGTPYLQETGASKVRALFGISWQIDKDPQVDSATDGHKTFTFHGRFYFKNSSIEAEGSRSSKDEFFAGKGGAKTADEIDMRDVRMAAYTNCINNGIKRILPGLRNIDIKNLEAAGLNTSEIRGYTFKEGKKGGQGAEAANAGLSCGKCGTSITQAEASFSESKFKARLCRKCQDEAKAASK